MKKDFRGNDKMQNTTIIKQSDKILRTGIHRKGFSVAEVLVAVAIAGVVALAISKLMVNQVKNSANTAQKNDLNTLVNEIQTVLNNSTTCTTALQNHPAFSPAQLTKQNYNPPIPVNLKVGSTSITAGYKYTNTLQISELNFTSIDIASAGQFRVELTLKVKRLGAQGVELAPRPFYLIAQIAPKPTPLPIDPSKHFILGCSGQFTNRWVDGKDNSITYNGGNVGIGLFPPDAPPSSELEVKGTIKAGAFMYTSDSRLKENVREISSPLEKVMKLHGVTFDWKDRNQSLNRVDQLGMLAQEVEEVFPEAVNTDVQTGEKSVAYGNLIAPLIEAIKEQQQIIVRQQKEIDEIKKSLSQK